MGMTITDITGDGIGATAIRFSLSLPDSGTSALIDGEVQTVGASVQAITGSPLSIPAAPASGTIFWNVQVDTTSGAATVQQSTSVDPAPINPNNIVIFRQSLIPGNTDPATVATDTTPDTW